MALDKTALSTALGNALISKLACADDAGKAAWRKVAEAIAETVIDHLTVCGEVMPIVNTTPPPANAGMFVQVAGAPVPVTGVGFLK